MSKRSIFTTITPLPASLTRKTVVDFLHNHLAMIDLNPLVVERHPIKPPETATADEAACIWYSLTDKIHYLPGGMASGNVSYTACFNDLPNGLQTHCRAPAGVDIQSLWSLRGSLPGEPKEPLEIGMTVPKEGLYLREDVNLKCNFLMSSFVKGTLKKAHSVLIDRLLACVARVETEEALANQFPMKNENITAAPACGLPNKASAAGQGHLTPQQQQQQQQQQQHQYQQQQQQGYRTSQDTIAGSSIHSGYSNSTPSHTQYAYSDSQYSNSPMTPDHRSYQSTQSNASYDSRYAPAPLHGLNPPTYQQGYGNYSNQGGYPPTSNYENKNWNPQYGWHQPTMEPVEIASSELVLPPKDNATGQGDYKAYAPEKPNVDDAGKKTPGQGNQSYASPARAHTYELQ